MKPIRLIFYLFLAGLSVSVLTTSRAEILTGSNPDSSGGGDSGNGMPVATPTDAPYSPLNLVMPPVAGGVQSGGQGRTDGGGNANPSKPNAIPIEMCFFQIKVPEMMEVKVPESGANFCVKLKGFPRYCPFSSVQPTVQMRRVGGWTYAARHALTSTLTATSVKWGYEGLEVVLEVCFSADMTRNITADDTFIYTVTIPRSTWPTMNIWWNDFYVSGLVNLQKEGNYGPDL